jgi:tight adherence protein B
VATAVFVFFVTARWALERLASFFRRREEPLLAERLQQYLAAVRPPGTLGERLDRAFERIVGRSALGLDGLQGAAALLLVGVTAGVSTYLAWPSEILAALAVVCAMGALLLFFGGMHRRWQSQVQQQLPDTFHLLARSLRAGLTVDQSLALIGEQGPQPLAREFRRAAESLRLGATVPAALRMAARSVRLPDFDLLVSLATMHRETGGNLALLVDRLGNAVRSRNHFRGHALAVTALGRVTGLVLAMAPMVLMGFYYTIYPDYLAKLTSTQQGLNALMMALGLEVVGVLWLAWLLRIDY